QRLAYPSRDGDPEASELLTVEGRRQFDQRTLSMPEPMRTGDLYLSPMRGGAGVGDPLERDPGAVASDLDGGFITPRLAESLYGVAVRGDGSVDHEHTQPLRESIRGTRRQHSQPVS